MNVCFTALKSNNICKAKHIVCMYNGGKGCQPLGAYPGKGLVLPGLANFKSAIILNAPDITALLIKQLLIFNHILN